MIIRSAHRCQTTHEDLSYYTLAYKRSVVPQALHTLVECELSVL